MLAKMILSTVVAGLLAGLILAGLQYVRLTPLIEAAEVYETPETQAIAEASKPCVETMPGMKMCSDDERPSWKPDEGWQRTLATTTASLLTGAGYALLLVGISMVANIPITKQNGMVWGLCGFIAVSLAPAVGLPPQLPGMPAADLHVRQIWWLATILATGAAVYVWVKAKDYWWQIVAVIFATVPHFFAPLNATITEGDVPAVLASEFASSSLAANLVMWLAIGFFVSLALHKYQKDLSQL